MTVTTIGTTGTVTPVRDYLTDLIDAAAAYKEPDGFCSDCIKSDTNRCLRCQDDQDTAAGYALLAQAVESAPDDAGAVAVLLSRLAAAGGGS